MKNLLLCLCCLLATTSSAQCLYNQSGTCDSKFRIGVKAGVNVADYRNGSLGVLFPTLVEDEDGAYFNIDPWPGYHFGIEVQYMFTKHIGISSGLMYSTFSVEEGFVLYDDLQARNIHIAYVEVVAKPSYLHLPINFLYKFDFSQKVKFYPSIGVYLGYGLGGRTEMKIPKIQTEYTEIEAFTLKGKFFEKTTYQRFDAGVGAGVALDINHFSVGVSGKIGLTNAACKENQIRNYDGNVFIAEYGITLGYFF